MYNLDDYDFQLPPELIAQFPSEKRDESRLLTLERGSGKISHGSFREIARFLGHGDLIVFNNTRVIPARLHAKRTTGGKVEVLVVKKRGSRCFLAMHKGRGRLVKGEKLMVDGGGELRFHERTGDGLSIFEADEDIDSLLARAGVMPLPHYINRKGREHEALDRERYQTLYAKLNGSIAAPTAGLHFTDEVFTDLKSKGVEWTFITLHVGVGTFKPVRSKDIRRHVIDAEFYEIPHDAAEKIRDYMSRGGKITACGTTVVRTLESGLRERIEPSSGFCNLYIYPPFEFRVVSKLITNFHLPKSSPILLVSALAGRDLIMKAYEEAKRMRYRFFSYGDAMLII